jgi:hypothetical protein
LREFGFDGPALEASLFLDPSSIVRFGVPPFRIEVMTAIDGVEFVAAGRHKDLAVRTSTPERPATGVAAWTHSS